MALWTLLVDFCGVSVAQISNPTDQREAQLECARNLLSELGSSLSDPGGCRKGSMLGGALPNFPLLS